MNKFIVIQISDVHEEGGRGFRKHSDTPDRRGRGVWKSRFCPDVLWDCPLDLSSFQNGLYLWLCYCLTFWLFLLFTMFLYVWMSAQCVVYNVYVSIHLSMSSIRVGLWICGFIHFHCYSLDKTQFSLHKGTEKRQFIHLNKKIIKTIADLFPPIKNHSRDIQSMGKENMQIEKKEKYSADKGRKRRNTDSRRRRNTSLTGIWFENTITILKSLLIQLRTYQHLPISSGS